MAGARLGLVRPRHRPPGLTARPSVASTSTPHRTRRPRTADFPVRGQLPVATGQRGVAASRARATRSCRLVAPVLRSMFETCELTVFSLRKSCVGDLGVGAAHLEVGQDLPLATRERRQTPRGHVLLRGAEVDARRPRQRLDLFEHGRRLQRRRPAPRLRAGPGRCPAVDAGPPAGATRPTASTRTPPPTADRPRPTRTQPAPTAGDHRWHDGLGPARRGTSPRGPDAEPGSRGSSGTPSTGIGDGALPSGVDGGNSRSSSIHLVLARPQVREGSGGQGQQPLRHRDEVRALTKHSRHTSSACRGRSDASSSSAWTVSSPKCRKWS